MVEIETLPPGHPSRRFVELHRRPGTFVMPNPWDIGSARLLAGLGFEALASTSAGMAFALGRADNDVPRDLVLEHCAALAGAVAVPINADLEDGFGAAPDTVNETIRLAAKTGIAGGSIEDSRRGGGEPVYELAHAVDRVRAAVDAARGAEVPFLLTARAENFIVGRPDLGDTIRRLQAYQEAGADVLYAPGLRTREQIAAVLGAVDRPLNLLMGMPGIGLTLSELETLGVKRISIGGALAKVALAALLQAAEEMTDKGTFTFAERGGSTRRIVELLQRGAGAKE